MKKGLTELVFILDESGSMSGMEADTIGGFNSMIDKQRAPDPAGLHPRRLHGPAGRPGRGHPPHRERAQVRPA